MPYKTGEVPAEPDHSVSARASAAPRPCHDDRRVAWKWEQIGGFLILGGLASFAIVNHGVQINLVFGPMVAVGLTYLVCGWKSLKV